MDANVRASLQGLKVVSFESRRVKEMAELIRRYGGEPITAPSMREVSLGENSAALELLPEIEAGKFDLLILMTGVGTKTLYQALLTRYSGERIRSALRQTRLVARGPKPVSALKDMGLIPAVTVPEPNTWREVVATLHGAIELNRKRIAIQEYGIANQKLVSALEQLGASVRTFPIYKWALPEDLEPLRGAIQKLLEGEADVALFTNGAQVDHLFRVATEQIPGDLLRRTLQKLVIASVGPVCTQALERFGLTPDLEPAHPKMGSLIAEVAAAAHRILATKGTV